MSVSHSCFISVLGFSHRFILRKGRYNSANDDVVMSLLIILTIFICYYYLNSRT